MSNSTHLLTIMSIIHVKATATHANAAPQGGKDEKETRLATRAEGGGGVNVGAIVGVIIAVLVIAAALLLIFIKTRNHNRSRTINPVYPSQKQSISAFSNKPPPQPLPLYTQPTSPYAQHYNGGVPMPQAVHPSTSGYYRQAGQVQQQDNQVRFGQVGVGRY